VKGCHSIVKKAANKDLVVITLKLVKSLHINPKQKFVAIMSGRDCDEMMGRAAIPYVSKIAMIIKRSIKARCWKSFPVHF
jgi:hypothetical protein